MKQIIDGIEFNLKEPYDFSFLKDIGTVFCVFDEQDSGNICFGIQKDGKKIFIKYAGANTVHYHGEIKDAIKRLKEAKLNYDTLKHENLVHFIKDFKTDDGYGLIFDWTDGTTINYKVPKTNGIHYLYDYRRMEKEKLLQSLEQILDFHVNVIKKGYVAIDFYDGCIMYNEKEDHTTICDIDQYQKLPFRNPMGRLWGSSRFMSPEEYEKGALIDEVTNVFTMGATMFELFGNNRNRVIDTWKASKEMYEVAKKAVSPNRDDRYQTLEELKQAWRKAINE